MGDHLASDGKLISSPNSNSDGEQPDFGQYEKPHLYGHTLPLSNKSCRYDKLSLSDSSTDKYYPWGAALGARVAYLGLSGSLIPTNGALKEELLKAGNVGEQLVKNMSRMEREGWSIGGGLLSYPEPKGGWGKAMVDGFEQLPLNKRLCVDLGEKAQMAVLNLGMNFFGGAYCDDRSKVLNHNGIHNSLMGILGRSLWDHNSATLAAPNLAHELSHNDGIPKVFSPKTLDSFLPEEQLTLAKRTLITEARAHLVEAAVGDALECPSPRYQRLKQYIQTGELGSHLRDTYMGATIKGKCLNLLTAAESDQLVNEYFSRHFGDNLVDAKTGKIRSFDINAGLDEKIGSTRFDNELLKKMNRVDYPAALPKFGFLNKLTDRSVQAIAGVAALVATADLVNGFSKGGDIGLSQVARSGVSLAGYEIGAGLLGGLCGRNGITKFFGALFGGGIGSVTLDSLAGRKAEQATRNLVHSVGKKLNIAYLAPENARVST